jgi:hypothetical protein
MPFCLVRFPAAKAWILQRALTEPDATKNRRDACSTLALLNGCQGEVGWYNADNNNSQQHNMSQPARNEFEKAAQTAKEGNIFSELWAFLRQNKKWWLLPIIVMFLVLGLLVVLANIGLAPFIYTLF